MTEASELPTPPPAAHPLATALARPKLIAVGCVIALAALGWLYLAFAVANMGEAGAALGPGMTIFDSLPRAVQAICRPLFGETMPAHGVWLIALMWGAMTLAMMLPTAGPMILTYAEIADTAARKGERIVSPLVLAAGYTTMWFGYAVAATVAQILFTRLALMDTGMSSASVLFSGAIFIAAGVYQFTPLKHACLNQCQRPFPFFFANWQTTAKGVFRLGVQQGLYCLGCCWAMMLLMFAVGVMNVVWMAGLGIVMTIEKIGSGRRFSHAVGVVLILGGIAFVAGAFVTHWPGAAN
jgi:predicted metal-binding membrane protein